MADNGVKIAIACEDQAHRALATFLADRVLVDEARRRSAEWIDDESLAWLRGFRGLHDGMEEPEHLRFYALKNARRDVEQLGQRPTIGGHRIKLNGHIGDRPLEPEAAFWRIVFALFVAQDPAPDALIVVHDTDGDTSRLRGLAQACELVRSRGWSVPVIVAAPHEDAEAWFVAGFVPNEKDEGRRLSELEKDLGFSPPEEPHRLTAHPNEARTDAKRVLRILVFDQNESRPPALSELPDLCVRTLTDLALLEQRGGLCGLAAFLQSLRDHLVPLLIPGPPGAGR